jgi:DNA-binding MarR family transcriptional regulator
MADINLAGQSKGMTLSDREAVALVEMLFFAYRDFVADPDEILAKLGFGRAHHRVLHFVGRGPGMTVAQLLDILRITKQSLGRVLKELVTKGYIVQREGPEDRRQRLLYLTPQGQALWHQLVDPQIARFREAAMARGENDGNRYHDLLVNLINPDNRAAAEAWIARAPEPTATGPADGS